ncbi:MAG TPA: pseudouridine synthase [Vicinamibacterales bacterium]|jgi:pseudouridine synthase|nr:pseudouridine synthase [Vicinamibacterales bacterium]
MEQRLQKILSQAGVASRRAAERLMAEGRVTLNGKTVLEMGTKADADTDDIRVDGRRLHAPERKRYILLNKPAGVVSTRSDPQRRRTVIDLLAGVREYVYPVGRLDYETEGLLILTNDGDLAARLTHPRHGVERSYQARVAGIPDADALRQLREGIPLDGRRTLPAEATLLNARQAGPGTSGTSKDVPLRKQPRERPQSREREGVLQLTIREGRNRQVRRMLEAVGHPVRELTRTRIGPLTDRRLKPGMWRDLTPDEVRTLQALANRPAPTPPPRRPRPAATRPRSASAR